MLDAISKRKSVESRRGCALGGGEGELCGDKYSTDDEFDYENGRPCYDEYASPTQPLYPPRPRSAPPRGSNPGLFIFSDLFLLDPCIERGLSFVMVKRWSTPGGERRFADKL